MPAWAQTLGAWLSCFGLVLLPSCNDPAAYRERIEAGVERALESDNRDLAIGLLERALSQDPRDAASARQLAELHLEADNAHQALAALSSVPINNRRSREFLLTHAEALIGTDRLDAATRILRQLDAPDTSTLEELFARVATSSRALEAEMPVAWVLRLAEIELAADDLPSAAHYLDRVDPAETDRQPLIDSLFQRLLSSDRLGETARLPGLLEGPPTAYRLLARRHIASTRGEHRLAAELEARFLADYPEHPGRAPLLVAGARRAVSSGDHQRALALAREAGAVDPTDAEPVFLQGLALHQLADEDGARRRLAVALAIDPQHLRAQELLDRIDSAGPENLILEISPRS